MLGEYVLRKPSLLQEHFLSLSCCTFSLLVYAQPHVETQREGTPPVFEMWETLSCWVHGPRRQREIHWTSKTSSAFVARKTWSFTEKIASNKITCVKLQFTENSSQQNSLKVRVLDFVKNLAGWWGVELVPGSPRNLRTRRQVQTSQCR